MSILSACKDSDSSELIVKLNPEQIYGEKGWQELVNSEQKVFYFLSPECPLCQNYALAMRELKKDYPEIEFIGIFPGKEYNRQEIKDYLIRYELDFNAFFDPEFKLTNHLGAEITPEAFLLNKGNNVQYSGAIDNWAISLGQKRTVITENYLEEAILASLNGKEIEIKSSKAVGCFIQ